MKKIFLFFIFFKLVNSYAQDWELFPKNSGLYYQCDDSIPDLFINYLIFDSSVVSGGVERQLFNTNVQNPNLENCRQGVYSLWLWYQYMSELIRKGDSVFYVYLNDSIYFLPLSLPGDSWTINTFAPITFHCDSIVLDTVLGEADSIKYFHLSGGFNNIIIELSRKHGFINYIPFRDYFYLNHQPSKATLIGYQDSLHQYGFKMPEFEDYFPYSQGDILKWHYKQVDNPSLINWDEYYRDSILSVLFYTDSVVILYDRVIVDHLNQLTFHPGQSVTYTRQGAGSLLEAKPHDVAYMAYVNFFTYLNLFHSELTIWYDTVQNNSYYEYVFSTLPYSFSSCALPLDHNIPGEDYGITFNTRLGIIETIISHWHSYYRTTLISATIGGIVYGNPELAVGIKEISEKHLKIFPNPVTDKLYFEKSNLNVEKIVISDITGKTLMEVKYEGQPFIDVSVISSGAYFFSVFDSERLSTSLFIKN